MCGQDLGTGLDPEIIGKPAANRGEQPQRGRLLARPSQRKHQPSMQALIQGLLLHQRLELLHYLLMAIKTESHVGVGNPGGDTSTGHPNGNGVLPHARRQVGGQVATPTAQCLLQQLHTRLWIGVLRLAGPRREMIETKQVQLILIDRDDVAAAPGGNQRRGRRAPFALDGFSYPRCVGVYEIRRAPRRVIAPEHVDDLVAGDHHIGLQCEQPQQRPLLVRPHINRPVPKTHHQRAEHADP